MGFLKFFGFVQTRPSLFMYLFIHDRGKQVARESGVPVVGQKIALEKASALLTKPEPQLSSPYCSLRLQWLSRVPHSLCLCPC